MIGTAFSDCSPASFTYLPQGIYAMEIGADGKQGTPYLIVEQDSEAFTYCEPHAIDLGDKILLGIRIEWKDGSPYTIYHCYSYDGGKTFTKPEATGFEGAPPHYFRHSSGAVILTYGKRRGSFLICARISLDGGVTFGEEFSIAEPGINGDLGYPCTTENEKGELVTVYYKKRAVSEKAAVLYSVWKFEK